MTKKTHKNDNKNTTKSKTQLRWQKHNWDGKNTTEMAKTQLRWQKHNWDGKNTTKMAKTQLRWQKTQLRWQKHNWDDKNTTEMAKTQLRWQKHNWGGKNTTEVAKTQRRWQKHNSLLSLEMWWNSVFRVQYITLKTVFFFCKGSNAIKGSFSFSSPRQANTILMDGRATSKTWLLTKSLNIHNTTRQAITTMMWRW